MATLTVTSSATLQPTANGGFGFTLPQPQLSPMTLVGSGFKAGMQLIGFAAEENLDYGDIASADAGWLFMRNLDATNPVSWGMSDAGTMKAVGTMKAGEPWTSFRVKASVDVRLQATTANCLVEYYFIKN